MRFPWLIFTLVCIPLVLTIWYIQHLRWQPKIDAAQAEIDRLKAPPFCTQKAVNLVNGRKITDGTIYCDGPYARPRYEPANKN